RALAFRGCGNAWIGFPLPCFDRFRVALIGAHQRLLWCQPHVGEQLADLVPLLVVLLTSCGSSNLEKMLIEAAHYGEVDKMSLLIDRGANVNGVALDGWTPLSKAADAGELEGVKLLLARGANINQTTSGLTPLFCAARGGHLSVTRLLVEKCGRLNLNPVLEKNFLNSVYSSQNQDLISLVTQVMTRERLPCHASFERSCKLGTGRPPEWLATAPVVGVGPSAETVLLPRGWAWGRSGPGTIRAARRPASIAASRKGL